MAGSHRSRMCTEAGGRSSADNYSHTTKKKESLKKTGEEKVCGGGRDQFKKIIWALWEVLLYMRALPQRLMHEKKKKKEGRTSESNMKVAF